MKILVLDMSPMARRLICSELNDSHYETIEAESSEQALEILSQVPDIELLTTAVCLGDLDGFDFIQDLRSPQEQSVLKEMNNHDVPVIIVTSNDTIEDRLKGFSVGAADFIQKPWKPGKLATHIDSVLGQSDELQGMSVLVAEDSPTSRYFIKTCLNRLGVTIHEVDDGVPALEFLKNNHVDLVLTDLNMINMDGDTLCVKIREELELTELPIIFLSANDNQDTIISLFRLGATDYLIKPFLQEELVSRLKVHLEREKLLGSLRGVTAGQSDSSGCFHSPEASAAITVQENRESRPPRILLVDDGPVNLAAGSKILQGMGCEVEAVTDGNYAVSRFGESLSKEPFDLIFMDLMMPNVNGFDATVSIRELEKSLSSDHPRHAEPVPIIALSASNSEGQMDDCLEAGMSDFQEKPFQVDSLRKIMDQWLTQNETVQVT